jgi:DNA-binding transcriptional ArsR family regulator
MSVVELSFAIVAEPNRRAILSLLLSSERSVGEIERKLRLSQPSVSKHLRVLREAGFVESRIEAQRRVYRLRPEPLMGSSTAVSDRRTARLLPVLNEDGNATWAKA